MSALAIIKLSPHVQKVLSNQNGYKCSKRKTAVGLSSNGTSKARQSKRQVSKDMFHKWQWTYKRDHQSMTTAWLRAEIDDQDKSLVSVLGCVDCQQYETRMCGLRNFSRAWTNSSSSHKTSNHRPC